MSLNPSQTLELLRVLHLHYTRIKDLEIVVFMCGGRRLGDLTTDRPDKEQMFEVITDALKHGWIVQFLNALSNDEQQRDNRPFLDALHQLLSASDPEPNVLPHRHLLVDGNAFANHDRIRDTIFEMANIGFPRVLVLRGARLAGASHFRWLINHVSRVQLDFQRLRYDFSQPGDHGPLGLITSLAAQMAVGELPKRVDLPSDEQQALFLANWLLGQLRVSRKPWWIVLDNAQRTTVPIATKELIVRLIDSVSEGIIDDLKLFVLGLDLELFDLSHAVAREFPISPISESEIRAYLSEIKDRYQAIPEFDSVDEALANILDGMDFGAPTRDSLQKVTDQLTFIARSARG